MTKREIIAVSISAVVIAIDLITDYLLRLKDRNVIKPEGSVNHTRGFWIRCIGLAPAIFFSWYKITALILFAYWHLFDGLGNILWKDNWFRIGTTSGMDKAMRKHPIILFVKYLGLPISIILYIVWN